MIFNYSSDDVKRIRASLDALLAQAEETQPSLKATLGGIENASWLGESANAFLDSGTRLAAEIDAVYSQFKTFLTAFDRADAISQETISNVRGFLDNVSSDTYGTVIPSIY